MKRNALKLFPLLVAILLTASLAACAPETIPSASKTPAASPEAQESAPAAESAAPEPVTLKVFGVQFGSSFPSGVQDDPVALEIARQTGVTLDIEAMPDQTKSQALIASGDLPDLFVPNGGANDFKPMIEGGLILPLDDLLASNGKTIAEVSPEMLSLSRQFCSNGTGKLYFLLGCQFTSQTNFIWTVGPWTRWDYYADMNYPEIKSADDWLNMTAEMVKAHPKTEDGKQVYGFSSWFDWGVWSFSIAGQIIRGFEGKGINILTGGLEDSLETQDYTGVNILSDDSALIAGVRFYYKANQMGILDPDCSTQKYDNAVEKFSGNRIIGCGVGWAYPVITGDKPAGYMPLPITTESFYMDTVSPYGQAGRKSAPSSASPIVSTAILLLISTCAHPREPPPI